MDYIGKVKLNYDYYTGTDEYSDSEKIENTLLEIVKKYSDYTEIINNTSSWPILYHLSEIRGNIIEWLPITKDDKVLEIGAGCGAITTFLAQKAAKVTCVELSKRRSLINAYKNKDFDNIEIFVGKFEEVIIKQKYDYIMLVGALEYAKGYIDSTTPYLSFLKQIKEFLKPNGKIIIAIENRLGLKYFAGCREDHTGNYFDGIQGYSDESFIRTFSKNELEQLFVDTGFQHIKFYYPYPDYKLPLAIYSGDHLPEKGDLRGNVYNFDQPRVHLFNEGKVFDTFVDSKLFPLFSNSFLCMVSNEKIDNNVVYIKYSNERRNEYKTRTEILNICGQKKVHKTFLKEEGRRSLQELLGNYEKSVSLYEKSDVFELLEGRQVDDFTIESNFVEGQAYDKYLEQIYKEKGMEYLICELKKYKEAIYSLSNSRFLATDKYMEVFGDICFNENEASIYPANLDLIPRNIILNESNDKYSIIDPEWTFDIILPIDYIFFRSIFYLDFLVLKDKYILFSKFSLKEGKKYEAMEEKFQSFVLNGANNLYEIYVKNNFNRTDYFEELHVGFYAGQDNNEMFPSLADKCKDLQLLLSLAQESLYEIDNSLSWKITKPLRIFSHKIRQVLKLFIKGIRSLKREGIKETLVKIKQYLTRDETVVQTENLENF
jgi:SAM-dependent methyltransferase